jgi:hypothetical protein
MIDTTICPECGELAEVRDRSVLESTSGPVEHVKVVCVRRHWFLLPVDRLRTPRAPFPVDRPRPAPTRAT